MKIRSLWRLYAKPIVQAAIALVAIFPLLGAASEALDEFCDSAVRNSSWFSTYIEYGGRRLSCEEYIREEAPAIAARRTARHERERHQVEERVRIEQIREAVEKRRILEADRAHWNSIRNDSRKEFEDYIRLFPQGQYANEARTRLNHLRDVEERANIARQEAERRQSEALEKLRLDQERLRLAREQEKQRRAGATESRVALVIGNSAYDSAPLRNPINDADDIARELERLGFRIILRKNANKRVMEDAIRSLGRELRRDGIGLFFYAGHAVQNSSGQNFLIPIGANVKSTADLAYETVDVGLLLSHMEEASPRVSIVMLDACRDNPFRSLFRTQTRGLAALQTAKGTYIAYATQPGNVAGDGDGRNGVFTKQLLLSLRQPGSYIHWVFERVTAGVARETQGKQQPWVSGSLPGPFWFDPIEELTSSTKRQ